MWGCPEKGAALQELAAGDCHPTSVSTTFSLLLLPFRNLGNPPSVSTSIPCIPSPPCAPLQIQWVLCDPSFPRNSVAFIDADSFSLTLLSEVSTLDFHNNFLSYLVLTSLTGLLRGLVLYSQPKCWDSILPFLHTLPG